MEHATPEQMDGFLDDLGKILRPKDDAGKNVPMGTIEVKLTQDTKMFMAMLGLGAVVMGVVLNKVVEKV